MLKRFLSYMFDANVSNEDKAMLLDMFLHFLGMYCHREGGVEMFGEGKATWYDKIYKKRFGFNSAWNIACNTLEYHKEKKRKEAALEELYNCENLN